MMPRLLALALFFLTLLFLPTETKADAIVLNSIQQGWYANNGTNNGVSNTPNNYFVGAASGEVYRNYFVFDLTYVTAITSAQLRIYSPGDSNLSADPFETYVLYDVRTPAAQLGRVTGVPIYDDLGSGTVFASRDVPTPQFYLGEFMTFSLNENALSAIQGSNGLFAIGGAITTLRFPIIPVGHEGLFPGSQGLSVQLIIQGQQLPTPEPGTLLLLGSGLVGTAIGIRKRQRAK